MPDGRVIILVVAVIPLASGVAYGLPNDGDAVRDGLSSPPARVDCLACHTGWRNLDRNEIRRSLNAFGRDYRRWKRSWTDPIQQLLQEDSDDDGWSNANELMLGSNPGDRHSTPKTSNESASRFDPTGRLADYIEQSNRKGSAEVRRQAAFIGFLLALLDQDAAAVGRLLPTDGYREMGQDANLKADALVAKFRALPIALPPQAGLDDLLACKQTRFVSPMAFKYVFPDVKRLAPTQFALTAQPLGNYELFQTTPVLILESSRRRWRVAGGNILSCWRLQPATQPAGSPSASPANAAGQKGIEVPISKSKAVTTKAPVKAP